MKEMNRDYFLEVVSIFLLLKIAYFTALFDKWNLRSKISFIQNYFASQIPTRATAGSAHCVYIETRKSVLLAVQIQKISNRQLMLLAIDIGNSNVVLALYNDEKWQDLLRIPTLPDQTALYYKMVIAEHFLESRLSITVVDKVILSSVVPELREVFIPVLSELFQQEPIVVGPNIYDKLPLEILRPDQIGTDLVANAMSVFTQFKKDCIIVDFGTALSFTIVNKEGKIEGINIAPGLKTAVKALVGNTAQLPEIPLRMPDSAIGKDTVTAIQSGILIGYVGLVRHQLASIRKELGEQYIAVATGGLSRILTELEEDFEVVDRNLTMDGLRFIAAIF
ncbi:MAG: type III pantothenate kinase [Paraglaciecola sp.]|jgi:type III pantothenate kinase